MGRPRMNAALPVYASAFTDAYGKQRIRLRRTGWPTTYVCHKPGTPEFTESYHAWLNNQPVIAAERVERGTFDDLITRFYRSVTWANLKDTTRETYRGELDRFRAKYGDRRVATMKAKHVAALIAAMSETPSAGNNLLKRLRQLFDFAIQQDMRTDNPAKAVKSLKTKSEGHKTWQEEQIAQLEAAYPLGTMPRLAFDLALYTAQRKSDLWQMGPQHIESGRIWVKQQKTGTTVLIPIHPRLADSLAATATGTERFIVNAYGRPFTYDSFGMWFGKRARAAGLEGYTLHGLRKASARRMAELGLSNQLIKSITGHRTDSEVSRYTRDANQAAMAEMAGAALATGLQSGLAKDAKNLAFAGDK